MKLNLILFFIFGLFDSVYSHAGRANLKNLEWTSAGVLQADFDMDLTPDQISIEFLRDLVQLSIKDSSIYPAKILAGQNEDIQKVFAYQYTPGLVRIRLSVPGDAIQYKDRFEMKITGRKMTARVKPEIKTSNIQNITNDQEQLLKRISAPSTATSTVAPKKSNSTINSSPLSSLKPKLIAVLCLLAVGFMFLIKKTKFKNWFGKKIAGINQKEIEVVASHYLGPKKIISIVNIAGQRMVLGVTEESINLIAKLDRHDDGFDLSSTFEAELTMGTGAVAAGKPVMVTPGHSSRVRDRIRKKLEGMKEL